MVVPNDSTFVSLLGDFSEYERLIRRILKRIKTIRIQNQEVRIITNSHPARVALGSVKIGAKLGLDRLDEFVFATMLHDCAKHHEDVEPLLKHFHGKKFPTDELRRIVTEAHTRLGPAMIRLILDYDSCSDLPVNVELCEQISRFHHPEIDKDRAKRRTEVKIASIVDKFDAMTSGEDERSHREKPYTPERAVYELWTKASEGFLDSELTRLFVVDCLGMELPKLQ